MLGNRSYLLSGAMGLLSALLAALPAAAQRRQAPGMPCARIVVVTPAGGRACGTVEVSVSGQDLEEPTGLLFSAPGFQAEQLQPPTPAAPKKRDANPAAKPSATHSKVTIPADTPPG